MYSLIKQSETIYTIVLFDKPIGQVERKPGKWRAVVGNMDFTAPNRKQAVEHLLKQIIMLYASRVYQENTNPVGIS